MDLLNRSLANDYNPTEISELTGTEEVKDAHCDSKPTEESEKKKKKKKEKVNNDPKPTENGKKKKEKANNDPKPTEKSGKKKNGKFHLSNLDSKIIKLEHAELISKWIKKTNKLTSSYEFKLIL